MLLKARPLNSIRARMTLAFAGTIAFLMLTVCSGMTWYARHRFERSADALLRAMARKVLADQRHDPSGRSDLLEDMRDDLQPNGLAMLIVDSSGRIVAKSQRKVFAWPHVDNDLWRVVSVSLGSDSVVIGLPWRKTERALRAQTTLLFTLGLFVVVVAGVGAWLLVGHTLSPIAALTRQTQAASVENLRVHLPSPSRDAEIVDLVTTLNGLLSRAAETVAAKGRFHAAASHELRTPLQALSGHLELAVNRERTNDEYRAVVHEAYAQTRRLTSLTRDLLLLHQLDSAPTTLTEIVNLADICDRTLVAFSPTIRAQRLKLESELPHEADLLAPPTHAEMLIRNLIENAVKYARADGSLRVTLIHEIDATWLGIFNECDPLSEWNPDKLFEPFYRPDASRNSRTGGTGLGLAICKAIASANGWQITLHQHEHGVLATVVFPTTL